jgi:hypothetical protein
VAWGIGLLGLAYVPRLAEGAPCLGVLRGPLGLVLLALSLGVALFKLRGGREQPVGVAPVWLFAASLGLLLVAGLTYTSRLAASGDEPHYLLMAQSLWRDHDLDLENNLARGDWREYTSGPLTPHYGTPRRDGRPYPAHSVGLPLLLAPVYAAGGRAACVVLLALLGAALTMQVRAFALRATGDERAALWAWAAALGPPVAFYSFHVYTEVPSALALAVALRLLLASPGPGGAAAAALLASALPWLHLKMIPAAAALGLIGLLRLRGRSQAAFLAVAAVMAAAYLGYFQVIYGHPTPLAIYGGVAPAEPGRSVLRSALGPLLDRSFGLLPCAPVFLLALPGIALLFWIPVREAAAHALLALAVVAPILGWRMWWGGQCPPARFLVPVMPFLGLALALRAATPPRGLLHWRWPLLLGGFALAAFMIADPARLLLLNRGDRPTRVWAALAGTSSLGRYLPSLTQADPVEARVAALWVLALALLLALDQLALSRDRVDRLFRGLGLPLVMAVGLGLLVDAWARGGERPQEKGPLSPQEEGAFTPREGRSVREPEVPALLFPHGLVGLAGGQGQFEGLLDRGHEVDLEVGADVLGDVLLHRLLVAFGEEHLLHAQPVRGQDLLLDPPHGEHATGERHLSRHGHPRPHGAAGEQGDDGRDQGDAGRGPVLGDRPLRHVEVQVHALEEGVLDAELAGVGPHPGECGLRALLHHVPQLPGQSQPLLAEHLGGLDVEHLAPGRGPGEA